MSLFSYIITARCVYFWRQFTVYENVIIIIMILLLLLLLVLLLALLLCCCHLIWELSV